MLQNAERGVTPAHVTRMSGPLCIVQDDALAVEEPLELRLAYGPQGARTVRSISVTMRTPGNDFELAVGFLMTEGVVRDAADIEDVRFVQGSDEGQRNTVQVSLLPDVEVSLATLERNFYTTSSCGICGKASLLALRTVCPPRAADGFAIAPEVLYALPDRLRAAQSVFDQTGGLHAAGLFTAGGDLLSLREDVGRHNAVDKLIGAEFLADRAPLRDRVLLLSGRASFELLQKSVMAGLPMVAAVGAPSSLAVQVAKEFNVTLVGFLRGDHCNVYHGAHRIRTVGHPEEKA